MKKHLLQLVVPLLLVAIPTLNAAALNFGSGTYGSCQYSTCSLSITSNGTVNLAINPSGSGTCTTRSDTVSVFTDNSAGFTLTLAGNTTSTALESGANTIPATSGTFASPVALTANTWGYRIDSAGGFGAGPTSNQTDVALNATTYAGIKPSNVAPETIVTTSAPANPTVDTLVWYSACSNSTTPPGSYTNLVTYTAVTN
jgi:hypothetical protein